MRIFYIISFLILVVFSTVSLADEIAIISNKEYPVDHISMSTLREIYLGEKLIEGDIRIKPFNHKDHKIKILFLKKVLGFNEDKFNAYWIKKVFQEGGVPPVMKNSSTDMIKAVEEEKGGIGYVWKHEAVAPHIKILLILDAGEN